MKKKLIFFAVCFFLTGIADNCFGKDFTDTLKLPPGQNGSVNLILEGIKTEKENVKTAEASLVTAKTDQDIKKPGLEIKKQEYTLKAQKIYADHNLKHETGSALHIYWNTELDNAKAMINTYTGALKTLQDNVDNAQSQKDMAELKIKELQGELLDFVKQNSNMDCAKLLSPQSPVEAIVQCWNCLFDNNCGNYGPPPTSPFDINAEGVPLKNYGAPPIMGGAFHNQQLQNLSNGINKKPVPPPPPPQKGIVEQATDKVRSYFNEVINKSKNIKNRVMAVLAVRG